MTMLSVLKGYAASTSEKDLHVRKKTFDFDWKFKLGDHPEAKAGNFDDSNWRSLDLPHDWSIEGKIDAKNPTGNDGGYFPTGVAWYRKSFEVPSNLRNKKIVIHFEGVYMNSEVFINGNSLGIRPYGYSSFYYDLSPYLKFGEDNIIAVRVDNSSQKNSRWYSGSGIYRHVWLNVTDPVHIGQWGVAITTPEASKEKAKVQLKTTVSNGSGSVQHLVISTSLYTNSEKQAGKNQLRISVEPNESKDILQSILVEHPLLWSTTKPHLYQAQVEVLQNGKKIDQIRVPFGIRTINFTVNKGFLLNGDRLILNGGCVHHDNGVLGAAAYDRAEIRKAELLKAAGFNSVRTSHNPPSEAFLDACDQLGLLVIDESFDGWRTQKTPFDYAMVFDKWWRRDIEAMVLRDRNHPSIIMWSTGNEIIERKEAQAVETATKLASLVRQLDPSRPVTSAMTTWDKEWEMFDPLFAAHDIGGYNYQLHRAPADHIRVPSRMIVQTESYPRDAFKNWKLVKENSYVLGDYVWTAMDYLGESGIGRYFYDGETKEEHYSGDIYPWHGAYCGDIDLIGWRKPISHYRDLLYNEDKRLYMAVREPNGFYGKINETLWSVWPTWESWTWPGHEGKNIEVDIYSRYSKVRLYLNDKLIGEKETGEQQEFKVVFAFPYAPGKLRAVGIDGNMEVEEQRLQTAGKATGIRLSADRSNISADGQDLSFVTVELIDDNGIIQPNASNRLTFEVEGEGVIAAVGNADLKDLAPYVAKERNAWKGKALVVIRSTRKSGPVKLKVSSAGLKDASTKIMASTR